jgi:hypothetical protein
LEHHSDFFSTQTHVPTRPIKKDYQQQKKLSEQELLSMGKLRGGKKRKRRKNCVLVSIIHRRKTISLVIIIIAGMIYVWRVLDENSPTNDYWHVSGYSLYKWRCVHMFHNGFNVPFSSFL